MASIDWHYPEPAASTSETDIIVKVVILHTADWYKAVAYSFLNVPPVWFSRSSFENCPVKKYTGFHANELANIHVINDIRWFVTFRALSYSAHVGSTTGELPIVGCGSIYVQLQESGALLALSNVAYAPQAHTNILSLQRLVVDYKLKGSYSQGDLLLGDSMSGATVLRVPQVSRCVHGSFIINAAELRMQQI